MQYIGMTVCMTPNTKKELSDRSVVRPVQINIGKYQMSTTTPKESHCHTVTNGESYTT